MSVLHLRLVRPIASLMWLCDHHTMLRSLEINATLSALEEAHRVHVFWEPKIELTLDSFVCERKGRTIRLLA